MWPPSRRTGHDRVKSLLSSPTFYPSLLVSELDWRESWLADTIDKMTFTKDHRTMLWCHCQNYDTKGELPIFITKTIPTNDKGRFYAFRRVLPGTVASGQKVRIVIMMGGKVEAMPSLVSISSFSSWEPSPLPKMLITSESWSTPCLPSWESLLISRTPRISPSSLKDSINSLSPTPRYL